MLKLCDIKDSTQSVWLVSPGVTVGRAQSSDLCIADDSIAKAHLKISVDGDALILYSLSGDASVLLNGKSIGTPCRLKVNDQLRVGSRTLKVIDPKMVKLKSSAPTPSSAKGVAWALRANHRAIAGKVFPVKGSSVVGRSDECDIAFSLSHLSRRHARLEVREGLLFVVDLGSANGTFINNRKVSESRVRRGDELRFDTLSFSVVGPADDNNRTALRPALAEFDLRNIPSAAGGQGDADTVPHTVQKKVSDGAAVKEKPSGKNKVFLVTLVAALGTAGYFWGASQGVFG
ncbi:FHA domain-containing protein [Microbulbifer sp. OS29]|uniref:FHA domain-containing protein n=1 Tax=Microbulbifer okhotskensis TaxID=2926617 RepID=A0A9X2J5F2_9GAMM|nr:FHA domain-containing protein [Microbulbifer okhotskensis]MCO1333525.1 FHA domain-containing protein [Microbulbifer okhotskensis]